MTKTTPAFTKAYKNLNPQQKKAVDTIEGPVMVIAGPGTGKTQILATRIAHILLTTDTNPSSILALTFTESGAQTMQERLVQMIGETAYYIHVQTFHAFCSDVIQSHPEYFPIQSEGEPLSDLERYSLFQSIFDSQQFEHIKPVNAPYLYLRDTMRAIQDLKREGVLPDEFQKIVEKEEQILSLSEDLTKTQKAKQEKHLAKNKELLTVYTLYQEQLRKTGRFDFEDMIALVVEAFENNELLLREYQENLHYFLVDEYQDTNSAQNKVITLLTSYWKEQANIFVVGDPNQSIYRFQGASLENVVSFTKDYPNAEVITLTQNYRSTQIILDASKNVIDRNVIEKQDIENTTKTSFPLEQNLQSQNRDNKKLSVYAAQTDSLENIFIAQQIHELIEQGTHPKEIAVIYRTNKESEPLKHALTAWNIPFEIDGGIDVLKDPIMHQLIILLQTIAFIRKSEEDIDLFTLLNYEWIDIEKLSILKLARASANAKISMFALLKDEKRYKRFLTSVNESEKESIQNLLAFVEKLIHWGTVDAQMTFPEWFEMILNESGYIDWILNREDSIESLTKLNSLFREVKLLANMQHDLHLESFLHAIALMQEHYLSINQERLPVDANAVHLTTAHKAKGQEFKHVFIYNCIDKAWGNNRVRELIKLPAGILRHTNTNKHDRNQDERRLFYVALTRAKKTITISYSKEHIAGSHATKTLPSMFIQEIDIKHLQQDRDFDTSHDIRKLFQKLFKTPKQPVASIKEQEFLQSILQNFKLSPTALNTYIQCPYKFKLNNLLKVPRAKISYLAFGTAIHKALEDLCVFLKNNNGDTPELSFVLESFKKALQKELLTKHDFEIRLKQGEKVLTLYYETYKDEFTQPLYVEKFFGYGWSKTYIDDIPLSGRIDKIEWVNPKEKTVKVIDYKTGKPKSKNWIEGKTKYSDGSYKRQLVFYKLLTMLDSSFKPKVVQAEFDFVEANSRGKLKKETFEITKQEVEELKNLIRKTMEAIRHFAFPKTSDYSICKHCEFTNHCWPEGIPQQQPEQLMLEL